MEALIVIAVVVAAVWGAAFLLRGGLLGGCLAVLLAGICFGLPMFKIELGPLPLTADRMALAVLVAQYVLWRRWGWADPKPLGRQEYVLMALVAIMFANTFRADWKAHNYQPVSWLILNYLMPAALYWIARQERYTERNVLMLFGCLAAFGVYLGFTTLAEYFQIWWLVYPKYIVATAATAWTEFVGRGRGPLLHAIGNGVLLSICLGAATLWWPRFSRGGQLVVLAVCALLLAALFSTLTRSVWMGGALTLALAVGLALPWSWRLPILGAGVLAAILLGATQWENLLTYKRDRDLEAGKAAESAQLRPILATIAWKMFLDRPLFGCGYAQYRTEHLNYLSDRSTDLPLEKARGYIQHNVLLALLTETGLVGLITFLALAFYWTRDAWRLWSDWTGPLWTRQQGLLMLVALGVYFVNGMFHDVSAVPMINMTLFFLAGATEAMRDNHAALVA